MFVWVSIIININLHLSLNITIAPITTQSPSRLPSISPITVFPTTLSPTIHPTKQTDSPSNAPTTSPSRSPTSSPTRHPTTTQYPNIIHIGYNLTNITRNISTQLYNQTVIHALERNIEASYLLYSRKIIDDQNQWLHFRDFHLIISNVITKPDTSGRLILTPQDINIEPDVDEPEENQEIEIHTNYSALLLLDIYYLNTSIGTDIRFISKQDGFRNFTQNRLHRFFHYYHIFLLISRPFEDDDNTKKKPDNANTFFIAMIGIGIICVSFGFASFIYNNCITNSKTDNANSIAPPLYGLQIVDLFSDVNLCGEMMFELNKSGYNPRRISLYISITGVFIFTIIPYISNMIMAVGVKNIGVIKNNPFAKSYFQTTSWFFIVLVVFCGGIYPALSIVSCRLFAFEFLNSGLTSMELTKLTKIRFYFTILSENIPQVCCAMLYIYYRGTPTQNTVLSLIMSLLQILNAILNFIAMRIPNDCHIIQYDLEMKVGETLQSQYFVCLKRASSDTDIDIDEDIAIHDVCTLTKKQKQQIGDKKERKSSLRRWICTELSLRLNAVEIGYVTLTPNGCIVHMIHYIFESEALAFQNDKNSNLNSEKNNIKQRERWKGDDKSFLKTAQSFLKYLYQSKSTQINCAFASHFGLFKQDEITVIFHRKYKYSSWAMANKTNFSNAQMSNNMSIGEAKFSKLPSTASTSEDERDESKTWCSKTMSVRSVELQQGMDEMQILTKKIKDKLAHKPQDKVREELLDEGYDGELIDKMINLGKIMSTVMITNN
eukprot:104976_1